MKKLLLLLLLPHLGFSQHVFVTHDKREADKLVYRTNYFCDSHLTVKRTYDWSLPIKHTWFFVTSKQAADSGWTIYYVDDYKLADLRVHFTNRDALLGEYTPSGTSVEESITIKKGKAYKKQQYERKLELKSWVTRE